MKTFGFTAKTATLHRPQREGLASLSNCPKGIALGAALCVVLTACATARAPEPKVTTITVHDPVLVSCVPDNLGPRPTFTDTDQALKSAPDFSVRYQLLASEHARHFAFEDELWNVVQACKAAGASK